MKKKFNNLNKFLFEQEDPSASDPSAMAGGPEAAQFEAPKDRLLSTPEMGDSFLEQDASVDQIVDKYFMQYEKDSVPLETPDKETKSELKPIDENKRYNTLSYFLFEQEAVPAPDAAASAPAETPTPDAGSTDTSVQPGDAAKTAPVPRINIRLFAQGVARLVNNYQSLVDPKRVILNRAQAYIAKNYSTRLAKELMNILERDFDLSPKTKAERKEEVPPAPRAGRAGPEGGGGGGWG